MALITETAPAMNDSLGRVRIEFTLDQSWEAAGKTTLAQRLSASIELPVDRNDGLQAPDRAITFAVRDTNPTNPLDTRIAPAAFTAGDSAALRGLLLKLYNSAKTALDV